MKKLMVLTLVLGVFFVPSVFCASITVIPSTLYEVEGDVLDDVGGGVSGINVTKTSSLAAAGEVVTDTTGSTGVFSLTLETGTHTLSFEGEVGNYTYAYEMTLEIPTGPAPVVYLGDFTQTALTALVIGEFEEVYEVDADRQMSVSVPVSSQGSNWIFIVLPSGAFTLDNGVWYPVLSATPPTKFLGELPQDGEMFLGEFSPAQLGLTSGQEFSVGYAWDWDPGADWPEDTKIRYFTVRVN